MMSWSVDRFMPDGETWRDLFDIVIVAGGEAALLLRGRADLPDRRREAGPPRAPLRPARAGHRLPRRQRPHGRGRASPTTPRSSSTSATISSATSTSPRTSCGGGPRSSPVSSRPRSTPPTRSGDDSHALRRHDGREDPSRTRTLAAASGPTPQGRGRGTPRRTRRAPPMPRAAAVSAIDDEDRAAGPGRHRTGQCRLGSADAGRRRQEPVRPPGREVRRRLHEPGQQLPRRDPLRLPPGRPRDRSRTTPPRPDRRPSVPEVTSQPTRVRARLARWSLVSVPGAIDERRAAVGLWISPLVASVGGSQIIGNGFDAGQEIPGSETERGFEVLDEYFGGVGNGLSGQIVFQAEQGVRDPEVVAVMETMFAASTSSPTHRHESVLGLRRRRSATTRRSPSPRSPCRATSTRSTSGEVGDRDPRSRARARGTDRGDRRRSARRFRATRVGADRHRLRDRDPHPGHRLGDRDGSLDRHRRHRRRRRRRARHVELQPLRWTRVRHGHRDHDRTRRRHRLRAVHHQSLPRRAPHGFRTRARRSRSRWPPRVGPCSSPASPSSCRCWA